MKNVTELIALANNPVPSGAVTGHFEVDDGVPLRYARWEATRGPRRGTVCLFHGRGEFIEKYFEVIADLRRRGFAVATLDWRGQGGSHRALANSHKGHIHDFSQYDKDLARFMKEIVLPDCPPPFTALAHSLGGNILLRNASSEGSWFERMVLTGPMLQFAKERMGIPYGLARATAEVTPWLGMGTFYIPGGKDLAFESMTFEDNPLTRDKERFERNRALLKAAPQYAIGDPTLAWLRAAFRSMAKVSAPAYAHSIRIPMLLIAAGDDRIVSTRQIEEFGLRLKNGTQLVLPRSRHEILQETDDIRLRFWAAFDAYLGVNREEAA